MPTRTIPHFIICGAPRSGTTWLVEALDKHPQVFMARPFVPEPKFFHKDDLYAKGMDYYLKTWFSGVPEGVVAGEKDTYYLENPESAGRIFKHLPEARLIFILREPGARAFSNYLWSKQHGHEKESFERAMELEAERERATPESLKFVRPFSYLSRSRYVEQLEPYYALFPREQILCLNFEGLIRAPERFLEQVQRHIGVDARPEDATTLGNVNMGVGEDSAGMPAATRKRLDDYFAEPNKKLFALLGPEFEHWQGEDEA